MRSMRCVIVGAGDFSPKKLDIDTAFIIAADGGRESLDKMGIIPDICIGDFDSLGYVPSCNETVTLPVEKDVTDTFAAADLAIERGYDEIELYGALGGDRFSHSLANLQLLVYLKKKNVKAVLYDEKCTVRVLSDESVTYEESGRVSFISSSDKALISIFGMKYNGEMLEIRNDFPLGISNEYTEGAKVTVHEGFVYEIRE